MSVGLGGCNFGKSLQFCRHFDDYGKVVWLRVKQTELPCWFNKPNLDRHNLAIYVEINKGVVNQNFVAAKSLSQYIQKLPALCSVVRLHDTEVAGLNRLKFHLFQIVVLESCRPFLQRYLNWRAYGEIESFENPLR